MGMDMEATTMTILNQADASTVARARRPRRCEASAQAYATPEQVFARLDDQTRLAEHMGRPSAMMGGGRMTYEFDAGRGMAIGSHIRMGGSAFGLRMFVDEVVTVREPPLHKAWRTVGAPKLLIIGAYDMGFELTSTPTGASVRVWITYELPSSVVGRLLGWIFAGVYARWCVNRMAGDAARAFPPPSR
jgi:hypothetical protein